jgi:hypothetical protein
LKKGDVNMTINFKNSSSLGRKLMPACRVIINGDSSSTCGSIADYLSASPYFFDEYTIHGIPHIEKVLEYAEKLLITKEKNSIFKDEQSVSVLVMGICLHDLGMFIKPDGLETLLAHKQKQIFDNDDKKLITWQEAWDKHIAWIKRASSKELDNVFGDASHDFSKNSKHTCDDFIRRYHHEIAYYIATVGFPGASINNVLGQLDPKFAKLVGILAKSHGVSMRSLSDEIDSFGYDNSMPLHIPIFFLMAVLRLADLLDADGQRAPKIIADMNHFSNAKSKNEWMLNQLITDRQWSNECGKPETLRIIAHPTNTTQYLELASWFDYWQKELDTSWAVLGEKHGDRYKLSTRRISTTLDDAKKYNFLTKDASLKVNPDVVGLLINPLYDSDPRCGVRELLANAIDACRERGFSESGYNPEITLEIDTASKTFTCSDNGVGMDANIIVNYFMTVGASFRNSDEWRKEFAKNGKSNVLRAGRFGVGILAAYLLGEQNSVEIQVTTRRVSADVGYSFNVKLNTQNLDVRKISSEELDVGTKIVVKNITTADAKSMLRSSRSWPWYIYNDIKINYVIDGEPVVFSNNISKLFPVTCEQHELNLSNGIGAKWWFGAYSNMQEDPGLTCCNGIYICGSGKNNANGIINHTLYRDFFLDIGWTDKCVNIDYMDKQGVLPISLDRNSIGNFTASIEICYDVLNALLAEVLFLSDDRLSSPFSAPTLLPLLFAESGYIPLHFAFYFGLTYRFLTGSAIDENDKRTIDESFIRFALHCATPIGISSSDTRFSTEEFSITQSFDAKAIQIDGLSRVKLNEYSTNHAKSLTPNMYLLEKLSHEIMGVDSNPTLNDLTIPYDLEERRKKFPNAFRTLESYVY